MSTTTLFVELVVVGVGAMAWLCLLIVAAIAISIVGSPHGILTRNTVLGAALQHTVITVLFGGVLLGCLLVGTSAQAAWVNQPTLQFFGYISYGLYLIHLMVFRVYDVLCRKIWPELLPRNDHFGLIALRFVFAGSAAVGLAYLSRKYFEQRFLNMKDKLETSQTSRNKIIREGSA